MSHDAMREVLAFALATADRLGIDLYTVKASNRGEDLECWVDGRDRVADVRRLAEALGITDRIEDARPAAGVFVIRSRGQWAEWETVRIAAGEVYPYSGRTVPFGNRLLEVAVACSITKPGEGPAPGK